MSETDPASSATPSIIADLDDLNTIAGLRKGAFVLGRFKLERCLGRGGMGEVWLAHDRTLDENLALKLLPRLIHFDERAVEDLKNETRRGRQLSHPNIIRVFDFHQDDQNVGIAMEFVSGENLSVLHGREPHGVFTADKITHWTRQLLQGLDYAHRSENVVHRDLKPANLMIDQSSGNLKIADFGIARCLAESMQRVTISAQSRGTLCYMSPEQAMGRGANPLDDLYAVGATLYQLLAGSPPFYSGDVFNQILKVSPSPISERQREQGFNIPPPPQWEAAIMRCLAKERADRPQSALEVLDLLGLRTGDMPAPLPYSVKGGATAPGVVISPPTQTQFPPAATQPYSANTAVGTSTIAVSTSAPVVTVLPGATRTIDLTRTSGHHHPTTGPKAAVAGQKTVETTTKPFPLKMAAVAAVLLLGGVGAFVATQKNKSEKVSDIDKGVGQDVGDNKDRDEKKQREEQEAKKKREEQQEPPAKEWRVPGHFPTIQAAIDAARAPGQVIYIGEQTWTEKISIKSSVRLIGTGAKKCLIAVDGRGGAALEVRGTKDVLIQGIGFAHSGDEALAAGHSAATIENSEAAFEDCTFTRGMRDGLTVSGASKLKLSKCAFVENAEAGLKATAAATAELTDCTFEKNNFGIISELADTVVTLTGGSFTGQAASAIVVSDQGRVAAKKVTFTLNKENGLFAHDSGTTASLSDCDLSKAECGIRITKGAVLVATQCRLRENLVGIAIDSPGSVEARENTLENNGEAGIILAAESKSGSVLIYGNTIKNNSGFGINIHGAGMTPDVSGNDIGPNAFPDIWLHGKAGGSYSKNTLRSAERFLAETAGPDDPGAGPHQYAADNVEKPAP